jgi:8-oxo-dGTP diphosphatase
MKTVRVVAAVISDGDKIFATQRGTGDFCGGWEFPGGKIEANESPQEALVREIQEELNVEIAVHELMDIIEYDYPTFHLSMQIYWCSAKKGEFILKEHKASKWLAKDELRSVAWLPADEIFIGKLLQYKGW